MPNTNFRIAAACLLIASFAQADTGFRNNLNLGFTLTDGNSETILGNATVVSEGTLACGSSLRIGTEGNYGESRIHDEKETTVENVRAFANARKDISKRWYAALNAAANYDNIAAIDYRTLLGPALGGYLLRREKTTLTAELGPTYIWEKVDGVTDNFLAMRLAERIELKLSETAEIWQAAEFIPKAETFDDFLLNAEVGISAAMSARMQLRLVLQLKHDSTPADDLKKNDITLISGVGIQL